MTYDQNGISYAKANETIHSLKVNEFESIQLVKLHSGGYSVDVTGKNSELFLSRLSASARLKFLFGQMKLQG